MQSWRESRRLIRQRSGELLHSVSRSLEGFRLQKILRQNGLPENLIVHSLRRTNASLLIAQGVDASMVARLLGRFQASTMLDIYPHALIRRAAIRGTASANDRLLIL